jgi:hypothetical protein
MSNEEPPRIDPGKSVEKKTGVLDWGTGKTKVTETVIRNKDGTEEVIEVNTEKIEEKVEGKK